MDLAHFKGINGVQYGARPVPIDDAVLPAIEAAAVDWFTALAAAIGPALEDRERKLASTPAVLAALGAVGHVLVGISNPVDRKARARQLAHSLSTVDWDRGKRWEGIAGKFTPKGAFAVGGAKETAYPVYSALADASDKGFRAVRNSAPETTQLKAS